MATSATLEAIDKGQAALDWFDSIHGDRENGRVLIEYDVLATLVEASKLPF